MVYCGKPSTGCQTCRSRRIKVWRGMMHRALAFCRAEGSSFANATIGQCDEARPVCAQCAKSNRVCSGYRDEVDLLFRNENKVTEIRAQRSAAARSTESGGKSMKKPQLRPVSSSYCNAAANLHSWRARNASSSSSPRVLPENAEQHALCHFFTNYVPTTRHPESTFLGYLLPVWREAGSESALSAATSTVALMGLGYAPERNQLIHKARQNYSMAISKLNAAISNPVEARRDETLLSVLLFSLYQKMVGTPESLITWTKHTDGAVALVKLRGKDISHSPISLQLFLAVRAQMIINQTSKCEPIPPLSISTGDWTDLPPSESESENAANRLGVMAVEIPNYRSVAYSLLSGPRNEVTKAKVAELLEDAMSFDIQLASWPSTVTGDQWLYKPFNPLEQDPDDPEIFYHGSVHEYPNIWVCSVWNDYRLARIFILAIVLNCTEWLVSPLSRTQTSAYKYATTNLRKMVDEISASVPFALGHQLPNVDGVKVISMLNTQNSKVTTDQASSILGGYSLMWPLFVASNVPCAPESQRRWLRRRQTHIAKGYDYDHAHTMKLLGGHVIAERQEAVEMELAPAFSFFMPPPS